MPKIAYFDCSRCGERVAAPDAKAVAGNPAAAPTVCPKCAAPLYVRYGDALRGLQRESVDLGEASMWRYRALLPEVEPVTLGEGFTPLLPSRSFPGVYIKDDGLNPTGAFKARGLALAVTMAKHYGLKKLAAPSAGNAAGALATYAARAGIEAHLFMPQDVPAANLVECRTHGAHVTLVDGFIGDCARLINERKAAEGWFDISSTKEPFRVEGKKTMGYEAVEQLGWRVPDAIIYPTGGGVGLVGMWKAFDEMEQLGWIGSERPKMIAAQATGCAPVVTAFEHGKTSSEAPANPATLASGLRVPKAYADFLVLDIVRRSGGTAIAVSDDDIMTALREWAESEGVFAAPEGAASLAAYKALRARGFLKEGERVVLFNTGSGYKYVDVIADYFGIRAPQQRPQSRSLGGIIQPY